jgi:hypothetical protein
MFENEHVLLVNSPYSHLHSFCATGELDCHGGGWESLLHGGRLASDLIFVL